MILPLALADYEAETAPGAAPPIASTSESTRTPEAGKITLQSDATAAAIPLSADHASVLADYDALLREHVTPAGLVDYDALRSAPDRLDAYVAFLATADLQAMPDAERLATLINAYNAFTLRLIADYPGISSIMEIPEDKRWKHARWNLAGQIVSLDGLEHQIIRKQFDEPRIHWAVVCAAISCPPLRPEAYTGDGLDAQLSDQSRIVHTSPKWLQFNAGSNLLKVTPLYNWYGSDFGEGHPAIVANVAPYVDGLSAGDSPSIDWLHYDWSLNTQ
ncbi:MAG: DUF547 domain-containing protein [Planctomycetota bacterium]